MKSPQLGLIQLFLLPLLLAYTEGQACFEPTDSDPYLFFSHKTAYQLVYNSKFKPVPYCQPKFIWMFIRHGTNYPTTNESLAIRQLHLFKDRVIKNHEERHDGNLCRNILDSLKRWEFEVSPMSEDDISPQGKMDMRLMAKRIKDKLSGLLVNNINQNTFKFLSSEDRKMMNSAEEFSRSMFGDDFRSMISIDTVSSNSSFIGFEDCPKQEIPKNEVHPEAVKFRNSPEYLKMVSQISARLGFRDNITDSIIHAMYESCRYNKALVLDSYPAWCNLFTRQELQILEYYEDLDFYYKYGYGVDFNTKVGCPMAQEIMNYLSDASKQHSDSPTAVFRFGSSAGLLATLIALDIAKDSVPLTSDSYYLQNRRQWKMSQVDPFAGNLAVIFYKCDQGDDENKVMFYLNEGVYDYPGCNVGLCSWKFLENKFKHYLEQRKCIDVCHDRNLASGIQHFSILIVILLAVNIIFVSL
ncbi:multiple inositol polyphosphate phosphatase 1-like [Daktulosphaira vitifoliae]|uniref:multiple inositol polyphosphate phosphatase 1-like n=1 Tax=Daktulosphaira vitifoliae TaxID=58002 RepID=UPI0021A9FDDF|nr:multiple inositol polyphosphate phosphatase 1-like [Daktulosphaira vitifoliae]